jgi:hypothetical protein
MLTRSFEQNYQSYGYEDFDNAILIMSVLELLQKKKSLSASSQDLFTKLQSADSFESKYQAVKTYSETNNNKMLRNEILSLMSINIEVSSHPETRLHNANDYNDIEIEKLESISDALQETIIKELKAANVFGDTRKSINSRFLCAQINNDTLTTEIKWKAIMHYLKNTNNVNRNLYSRLSSSLFSTLFGILEHLCINSQFDDAAKLMSFSPENANVLAYYSILHGQFKTKYMECFSTCYTPDEYIRVEKACGRPAEMPRSLKIISALSSFSLFKKESSSISITITYTHLSHLSELLNSGDKVELLTKIVNEYKNIKLTSSASSSELLKALENPSHTKAAWSKLIRYMTETTSDAMSLKNNGKKLFRVISKEVAAQVEKMHALESSRFSQS